MKLFIAVLLLSVTLCALANPLLHDKFPFEYNERPESQLQCLPTKCVGAGQSCSSEKGNIGCRPGTFASIEGREHKFCMCKPIPMSIWRAPCNMTGVYECGLDLKCQPDHEGINRCLGKRNHGDSCETAQQCKPGHDCKDGICLSVLNIGSRCEAKSPHGVDACPPDSWCVPNWLGQYTCQWKSTEGQECIDDGFCQSGLACNKGKCQQYFSIVDGQAAANPILCQSGFAWMGRCAPVPGSWHDREAQECDGNCGAAGSCMCATFEGRNNTGMCVPNSPYDHQTQDAIKAVFAQLQGKCYPDLMTPGVLLQPIPSYDCAMRVVGPKLMGQAFCWYLRNLQILNGNGLTPNCDSGFSLWLAGFCSGAM